MSATDDLRRDHVAQWAFDTRPVLSRFHLWLEDVEHRRLDGDGKPGDEDTECFVGNGLERAFITSTAVTALGTYLFGRYGEGAGLDKAGINRVKKDADAISAYVMSEGLWHLTRNLPENHAVMICLGEGLMPKAGETPEMGSNPLLGFGRVYARPQVAKRLDGMIHLLLNEPNYGWDEFWNDIERSGITVWGGAVDTLECTSRFAKGEPTGPLTMIHFFDQPIQVSCPYEGYVGTLMLPLAVVRQAEMDSLHISYRTPRARILGAIQQTYPDIPAERVHVWTLAGKSRAKRLSGLWQEWRDCGVHLVEDGWEVPGGYGAFTDSGTYTPSFKVGPFTDDDGQRHLFLVDGYAATAEAIQAASLDPVLNTHTSMAHFSARFNAPHDRETGVLGLDPGAPDFAATLHAHLGIELNDELTEGYRASIRAAHDAGMPIDKPFVTIDDFLPRKKWRLLSLGSFMLPDPYTGAPGVEEVGDRTYRVTVHSGTRERRDEICMTLRLMDTMPESKLIFSPLLDRFYATREYKNRAVRISDSGRIRNELQTLCLEALDFLDGGRIMVHFDRVDEAVLSTEKRAFIREVLQWYKDRHPIWFRWLEIAS